MKMGKDQTFGRKNGIKEMTKEGLKNTTGAVA